MVSVYEKEKEYLVTLPAYSFEACKVRTNVVSPISTVHHETNQYSVPTSYVGKNVLIKAFYDTVRVSCVFQY